MLHRIAKAVGITSSLAVVADQELQQLRSGMKTLLAANDEKVSNRLTETHLPAVIQQQQVWCTASAQPVRSNNSL